MLLRNFGNKVLWCSYYYKLDVVELFKGMTQLGSCDNVTAKLSGGFATDPHWTQSSATELVKETVKLFTPQRYITNVILIQL